MDKNAKKLFYKKMMTLAVPLMMQSLMLSLVAVADALMLGSVEQNAMAAVSLATQIQFIQNMLMYAMVAAGQLLSAQYWGKGDKGSVNDIFCITLKICGFISIVTFMGCMFCPEFLMRIFTNEDVLVEIGAGYLKIAGWSYLATGISLCYLTLMKVTNHAKMTAIISSGAVVINIIFNAVFIYGLLGAPVMGVRGAALSTLIARCVELASLLIVSFMPEYMHPDIKRFFKTNMILLKDFMKAEGPLLGAGLLWGIGFTSYTAFMGHLGTDAAAANSIAAVVRDMICCACNGVSGAAGIMVGNELGAGNEENAKRYGDRLVIISFVLGFASTIIMLAVTPALFGFVKMTPEAKRLLVGMMVIMAVYMIGRCVNTIVINGIFDAGGDTIFDMYSLAVCMWCIAVPLAFAGTFFLGWSPLVVYACTCLDEVGKIPWVVYRYKKYIWVKNLTREF